MAAKNMYQTTFSPEYVKLVEKRVNTGAKFLNHKLGPDWFHKIKTGTLALDDPYMCVLGQTFKAEAQQEDSFLSGFGFAMRKFDRELNIDGVYGVNHGFSVGEDEEKAGLSQGNAMDPWTLLGETWLAKIRQLKRERTASRRRIRK